MGYQGAVVRLRLVLSLMNAIRRDDPVLWNEIREFAAKRASLPKSADDGERALKYRNPDPPAGKKGNSDALPANSR